MYKYMPTAAFPVFGHGNVGVGWGGLGMFTFLELAHMVDATSYARHSRCYTWSMLPKAWAWGGVGMFTFLERNPNVLITCYLVFQHISRFRK